MKATVIREFGDKENGDRLYLPGNEIDAREERIEELEKDGYVKRVAEPKPKRDRPKEE